MKIGFFAYGWKLVEQARAIGKERRAEIYASTLNSLARFRGKRGDLPVEHLDSGMMVAFEAYLAGEGKCRNTTSFYMRNLRSLYNRAVEEFRLEDRRPFRHVYTGVEKTAKRAVTAEVIARVKRLPLGEEPALEFARDLFLLCFYLRGISFVDMAFLRKQDLRDGVLSYRRHKTGQLLTIRWEPPMEEIVRRHADGNSPYLLPIIREPGGRERRQYLSAQHLMTKKLKRIGERVACPIALTFYVARHGWASIARSQNIPLAVISEALGHDSEHTTRIYLTLLDTTAVDDANCRVIAAIGG